MIYQRYINLPVLLMMMVFLSIHKINAQTTIFTDNFETDKGWSNDPFGTDDATAGLFERGDPEETSYSGTIYQPNITMSGNNCLVSGPLAGSSVGAHDIDGGVTSIRSPDITLPGSGPIYVHYTLYLAHYSNSSSDDFIQLLAVTTTPPHRSILLYTRSGSNSIREAQWQSFSSDVSAFAGETIFLVLKAADNGNGSLVEAGLDDISIVQHNTPFDIQAAIDNAYDGDIIVVPDGVYSGNIDFLGKAITLVSRNGASNCIIDGNNTTVGVKFINEESEKSVLNDFTITNCLAEAGQGGGIHCGQNTSPTIINCIISNNRVDYYSNPNENWGGGGIYCGENSHPRIINCDIKDNLVYSSTASTESRGGGVFCFNRSSPKIIDCRIENNEVKNAAASWPYCYGGGIAGIYAYPELVNCTIESNFTSTIPNAIFSLGGGAYFAYQTNDTPLPIFRNCTFVNNRSQWEGGGLALRFCGDQNRYSSIISCEFRGNTTEIGAGGGIYCDNSSATVRSSTFDENVSNQIHVSDDYQWSEFNIDYCAIKGQMSGIFVQSADPDYDPLIYGINNKDTN